MNDLNGTTKQPYQNEVSKQTASRKSLFGIELVDFFHVPLERRIQTFAVVQWVFTFFFLAAICCLLFLFFCFTPLIFIPLLYLPWYLYDYRSPERGGRRSDWARRWTIWEYMRDYFPVKLIKTAELDPENNYLMVYHPHGITASGAFVNFGTEATGFSQVFPGIRPTLLSLRYQFLFPVCREYVMMFGVCCCSKPSIEHLLTKEGKGNAVVLVVGGASEALEAGPGKFNLTIAQRKGFVRIALDHGTHLVPIFAFGENDLFTQASNPAGSWLRRFQRIMTKILSFSLPLFHGRGVFNYTYGILPYRKPNTVIVGSPLKVAHIRNPTTEQVDEWHQKYIEHLCKHFETHKKNYGIDENQHLQII